MMRRNANQYWFNVGATSELLASPTLTINIVSMFILYQMPHQLRPKKKIVCFRFLTDPIKTCATQIYFIDLEKKRFFLRNP